MLGHSEGGGTALHGDCAYLWIISEARPRGWLITCPDRTIWFSVFSHWDTLFLSFLVLYYGLAHICSLLAGRLYRNSVFRALLSSLANGLPPGVATEWEKPYPSLHCTKHSLPSWNQPGRQERHCMLWGPSQVLQEWWQGTHRPLSLSVW